MALDFKGWWEDNMPEWAGGKHGNKYDPTDPLGNKASSAQQIEAAQEALRQQIAWEREQLGMRQGYASDAEKRMLEYGTGARQNLMQMYLEQQGYQQRGMDEAARAMAEGTGNAAGAIAGYYGAGSDAQRAALGRGLDRSQAGYDSARGDLAGVMGLQRYGDMAAQRAGIDSEVERQLAAGRRDPTMDPGYQFRQAEGEKAINRAAAARGGRTSGRAMQELSAYNQGLASEEYARAADRLERQRTLDLSAGTNIDARRQAAAMQAQQAQMALAQTGYGGAMRAAQMQQQAGTEQAGMMLGTEQNIANQGMQAGQDIGKLIWAGGQGLSDIYGRGYGQMGAYAGQLGSQMAGQLTNEASQIGNWYLGMQGANQPDFFGPAGIPGSAAAEAENRKTAAMILASIFAGKGGAAAASQA